MYKNLVILGKHIALASIFLGCNLVNKNNVLQKNESPQVLQMTDCKLFAGSWKVYASSKNKKVKICKDLPCESERYVGPMTIKCENNEISGEILEGFSSPGKPSYSPAEIFLEGEILFMKFHRGGNCLVNYSLTKENNFLSGSYTAKCNGRNFYPDEEGAILAIGNSENSK